MIRQGSASPIAGAMGGLLFVYGTLRRSPGGATHRLLSRRARFVGEATFRGRLFDLGAFPGAVASGSVDDRVEGELYAIEERREAELLEALDRHEECRTGSEGRPGFRRCRATVVTSDGTPLQAWIYLYEGPTAGLTSIPSGDYASYWKARDVR